MRALLLFLLLYVACTIAAQQKNQYVAIAGNVYVHISYNEYKGQLVPSNGLIVETNSSVLLIDTGWGEEQTQQIIDWVKQTIDKPITDLIVTHSHDDRTAGIPLLKKQRTTVWSTALTAEKIRELKLPSPDKILPADTLLNFDNVKVHIFYPGPGHTTDNITVYLPEQGILHGGCFIKSTEATNMGNVADANLQEWPASLKRLKKKFGKAKIIIPGHQGWEQASSIEHTLELLQKQATTTR